MALKDKIATIKTKGKELVKSIDDLRLDAGLFTNSSDLLISYLKDKGLALAHDFNVRVRNAVINVDETIMTTGDISVPSSGISFQSEAELGTFITPTIEEYAPISLTFWDTDDLHVYNIFNELYKIQISPYGTFKIGFNQADVLIEVVGLFTFHLSGVAIGQPLPVSLDQSEIGLLNFKVDFMYRDFEIIIL